MTKRAIVFAFVVSGLLGGCSSSDPRPSNGYEVSAPQAFTEDDKRVARALSISSDDSQANVTPQYRAALCVLALKSIGELMNGGNLLSDEQQRAFTQAQSIYSRRASSGLSQIERERTFDDVEAANPNQRDRARFAIGCLRDLT